MDKKRRRSTLCKLVAFAHGRGARPGRDRPPEGVSKASNSHVEAFFVETYTRPYVDQKKCLYVAIWRSALVGWAGGRRSGRLFFTIKTLFCQ